MLLRDLWSNAFDRDPHVARWLEAETLTGAIEANRSRVQLRAFHVHWVTALLVRESVTAATVMLIKIYG